MLLLTYCHLSNFKSISNWNLIFYCNYYGFLVAENCSVNMYMNTLEQKWCWTGSCGVSTSCWETCIGMWFHWHCWYSRYVMFCFIPEPKHKAIFFFISLKFLLECCAIISSWSTFIFHGSLVYIINSCFWRYFGAASWSNQQYPKQITCRNWYASYRKLAFPDGI